jgi:hypothetical protein
MFYTYAHYKPEGGLFYIGKGKRRRAYAMDGRNSHWQNIVNKYGRPHVELLAKWDTETDALNHEKLLISCFRDMGFVLANKADGGTGASGYKFTYEQKKNLSLAHIGQVAWNKGKKSNTAIWNKGVPMVESTYQKLMVQASCVKCRKQSVATAIIGSHAKWCGIAKPYKARATINGNRIVIGKFATKEEAQTFQDNYYKEHNIVRTAWNKGTKGVMTAWNKGIPMLEETKQKLSKIQLKRYRKAQ